ncbi:hypothetical protein [uncultured Brevundimonas sp.]|uniref:hypothetical protein n=1 Tax=uncultured Brevundimonas sp. TaxID=213418 RepID=UPI0030ED9CBC
MRNLAFLAPLAATLALAGAAQAQPAEVSVSIGPDLQEKIAELGPRDVQREVDRLAVTVRDALTKAGTLQGARIALVLTDLRPNRPTFEQMARRPGLDGHRSISIGGATVEGEVITADGQRLPVRYDWYSPTLADVYGYATWHDAERAFDRLAANLVAGRLVTR